MPYKGSNPLTVGTDDIIIPAHTLLREMLTVKGMPKGLTPEDFGCTVVSVESFIPTANTAYSKEVPHGLGVKPKLVFAFADRVNPAINEGTILWELMADLTAANAYMAYGASMGNYNTILRSITMGNSGPLSSYGYATATESKFCIYNNSNFKWKAGLEYTIMALGGGN